MSILKEIAESEIFNPIRTNTLYGEAATNNGMVPIYVILTSGSSWISKVIKTFTHSKYSHAIVAMNYYETVSMGNTAKNNGVAVESVFEFPEHARDQDMKITRRFIPIDIYEKMVYNIEQFKQNYKKVSYSFGKLARFAPWIPKKRITKYANETSFICSEFVALILSNITDFNNRLRTNIGRGTRYMLSPKEVGERIMSTFETVYEGPVFSMPMDLLYKADEKYIKIKKNILQKVLEKLKENRKEENHKQYTESYIPSVWNIPSTIMSVKMKCTKDFESEVLKELINISDF
ncbi:cysteine peptidase [Fusobacterium phage JD-Fnp4]|nr:cysteine peptidase [Fusobacterium phage JD-Fnp4]